MNKILRTFTIFACVGLAFPALAAEKAPEALPPGPDGKPLPKPKLEDIRVSHVWTRAARRGETTHIFMLIENAGPVPVSIRGAEAKIAQDVRLVRFKVSGPYFHSALVDPVPVPATGKLILEPGHVAVELWHVDRDMKVGETFPAKIDFLDVGTVTVTVEVDARSAIRYHDPDPAPKEGDAADAGSEKAEAKN